MKKTTIVTDEGLLSSNPQFKAFASSIDYGVIVANKAGEIVDFNDAALEIFGYSSGELRGKSITTIMPERFRDAHTAGMKRYNTTAQSKNIGKTLRLYGLKKDGTEFPLEIALSSWKNTDNEQYFTASIRKYSQLENNLGLILMSAAVMSAVMLVTLIVLAVRTF